MEIFLISKSVVQNEGVREWMKYLGCKYDGTYKTNAEQVTELAGRRCYMSFDKIGGGYVNPNIVNTRRNIEEYIENLLASGHGSVLEHTTFTFAIEGISRVCTAELNRHRAGVAISEGSMRYIRFDNGIDCPIKTSDREIRRITGNAISYIYQCYKQLVDLIPEKASFELKKTLTSLIRRILPQGTLTGGVWTFNVRALRHILSLRLSPAAEVEIQELAYKILEQMRKTEPTLFGDICDDGSTKYRKV